MRGKRQRAREHRASLQGFMERGETAMNDFGEQMDKLKSVTGSTSESMKKLCGFAKDAES